MFSQCFSWDQSHYKCYRKKGLKMEIRNYTDPGRAGREMPGRLQLEDPRQISNDTSLSLGQMETRSLQGGPGRQYNKSKVVLRWLSSWRGLKSHGHSPQSRVMTNYTSAFKSHVSSFHWHTPPRTTGGRGFQEVWFPAWDESEDNRHSSPLGPMILIQAVVSRTDTLSSQWERSCYVL